jgi:hypothetical protein
VWIAIGRNAQAGHAISQILDGEEIGIPHRGVVLTHLTGWLTRMDPMTATLGGSR